MHLQYDSTRGATLIHGITRALSRIPTYPRQLTYAHTLQNTLENIHLTAPSAVHLTTCFLPDSQHLRLSVKASLPLSPLQRFTMLNCFGFQHKGNNVSMIFFTLVREIFYDNGKLLPNFPFQLYPLSSFTIIFLVIHPCTSLLNWTASVYPSQPQFITQA